MNDAEKYLLSHAKDIMKEPTGSIKRPFIAPGAVYSQELWSWDAYWSSRSLFAAFGKYGESELKEMFGLSRRDVERHVTGSIADFFDAQERDGYVPIMIAGGGLFDGYFKSEHDRGAALNQCLPFLCQWTAETREFTGVYDRTDADRLAAYLEYYEKNQFDENSGLFFWRDDIMVGIDNNPTVFMRPPESGADIYLNCFVYLEYRAFEKILDRLGDARAASVSEKAKRLKAAINREMWDERDGLYYSQDVGFYREKRTVKDVVFHSGWKPNYAALPLKIRFWACFLPMYAGICDGERAERMCAHLTENDDILAACGIRSLAKNEKMYSLEKSGNPSNWLGAVWQVANYCVYTGLMRYGKTELAEQVRSRAVKLIDDCVKKHGDTFETYHPDTGEPFLNRGFMSFNLLTLDMTDKNGKA